MNCGNFRAVNKVGITNYENQTVYVKGKLFMAYLIFQDNSKKKTIPVADKAEFRLGRTNENDLTILDDPLVSRNHCAIYLHPDENKFILRDLSSNGTVINDETLSGEEAFLADGDIIKVGGAEFIFCVDAPERYQKTSTSMIKFSKIKKGHEPSGNSASLTHETLKFRNLGLPEKEKIPAASHSKLESSSSLSPGMEINGCRIIRTLSAGGRSTVYLALQEAVKRTVALEIYSERADYEAKLYFRDLVPKIGRVSHTNAVHFLDCGIFDDFCYLVMPYMPEGNLDDRISRKAPLSERESIGIIGKIAGALDCAMTEHCIIHLDLNPENVLFSDSDEPAVLGLGMSEWKLRNQQHGRTYFHGNPTYMSPEQALDLRADWRSDLYSLGIIFYEMLTGRIPFTAPDEQDMIKKHVSEKMVFPPNLTSDLVPIIRTMTAKAPESRFSSWGAFVKAMDSVSGPKRQTAPMKQKPALRLSTKTAGKVLMRK
ncbi:MAG TPA: hypothetical protein DET40_10820 [Lentisphaeria bacterium]|nr:MAG: hypothetical protein A2X45_11515 [Lentisphaerae bacterium GWF2_50_93]HCE44030.1 hypothetical protein [Lentisphaeria bacterium]